MSLIRTILHIRLEHAGGLNLFLDLTPFSN